MTTPQLKNQAGFTLMEILIVVILMGILAMVVIPQISVSSEDTKVSTLQSNLTQIRNLLEVYYAQHGEKYPGEVDDTDGDGAPADAAAAATAFINQLTLYTKSNGHAQKDVDPNFPLGPYVKGKTLPPNPFNDKSAVIVDTTTTDITDRTVTGNGTTYGYKFFAKTGVLIACDEGTTGGVAHADY
jgi:prepilin-type N-terminal cleavage/methylation domain-containing protein